MIRAALALLTTVAAVPAFAQSPVPVAQSVLPDVEGWMMQAESGREFRIFVAVPKSPPPSQGYPVLYMLDANIMFATAVDTIRALERRPGGSPAIVVGIGYADGVDPGKARAFDLTPRLGTPEPKMPGSGGAEGMLKFIQAQLKPEIAKRYKTDTTRETLFGHSFGGLFALYALVNDPGLFDTYVAASPSIWFEDGLIKKGNVRKRLGPKLAVTGATPRVLVTVGEYEQAADPDFPPPRLDILMGRNQVENAREFAEFLKQPGVDVKFELLMGEDHGTVIPVAISRGVRFGLAGAKAPAPAPKPVAWKNKTGVPILEVADYVKLTPEQRYKMRLRSRKIPGAGHAEWVAEFDRKMSAGLTYGEHRALAEERINMDIKHGTKQREE